MRFQAKTGALPGQGTACVVIGAGRSGLGASYLLRGLGAKVRLLEKKPDALSESDEKKLAASGIELVTGEHKPEYLKDAQMIVPSPGFPIRNIYPLLQGAQYPEIISEMELAWRCLGKEPVMAVTGTSGKTTTVSMAAAMLEKHGYKVFLGGNIGSPLSEYILEEKKADIVMLEASSFQLQGCSTFCPEVGVLLNITPNHLDYHLDMREYAEAKFKLLKNQTRDQLAVLGKELVYLEKEFPVNARKIWLEEKEDFKNMNLLGKHNQINAQAAFYGCRFFGVELGEAQEAMATFKPITHRLEWVRDIDGISFINDSKCTTVSSLKVSLEAFDRPIRLLCGGKFKGGDLKSLVPLVREKVVQIGLFGASRTNFTEAFGGIVPLEWHPALKDAVIDLFRQAEKGDIVLLAPATSSFDLYKNYEERGEDFKNIVGKLAAE